MANLLRSLLAITLLTLLVEPLHAAKVSFGEIEVAVDHDPRGETTHGYTEFRVQVLNRGSDRERVVTLEMPANTFTGRGGASGIRSIRRSVAVGPGKTVIVSMLQPSAPQVPGNGLAVYIDGRKQDSALPLNPATTMGGGPFVFGRRVHHRGHIAKGHGGTSERMILSSQRVPEHFFKVPGVRGGMFLPPGAMRPGMPGPGGGPGGAAVPEPAGAPPPRVPGPIIGGFAPAPFNAFDGQFHRSDSPISLWSTRWLAYTRYDMITITREDVEELERGTPETQAVLAALWRYVEAGGVMLVLGPGTIKVPAAWSVPASKEDGMEIFRAGFGLCVLAPDRDSPKWKTARWDVLNNASASTGTPWKTSRSLLDLNQSFTVVDDLGIPVRGLFALMILFGIAIGPVNLIVLSRKNKRIWLLWTVPALSALFCFAVLGYMLIAEGWRGHARVAGITLLDEGGKQAITLGKTAFYSPMTPGDGLRFSDETEVQIQGNEHPAYTSNCSIDWTREQHLDRGWVTARVPAHFALRKCESRRERLTVRREDGGLVVINALGTDIRTLTLADEKGQLFTAGPIAAGDKATLKQSDKPARRARASDVWRRIYTASDWSLEIEKATKAPESLLGPNTYLAVVEESPFLEQALKAATVRPSPSIVLGIMANAEEK